MRICFLAEHLLSGGVERTISYLSSYFSKNNDVAILNLTGEQFYSIEETVKIVNFNIPSNSNKFFTRIYRFLKRIIYFNYYIFKYKPDCVISLDCFMLKYLIFRKKRKKFKIISSERNNPIFLTPDVFNLKKKYYSMCDGIIFQTEGVKNLFPDEIKTKSIVIPNAVGNKYVYSSMFNGERRKAITAVGRLTNQKDYPTLLRAFKLFYDNHSDFVLEIFGVGELENELKEMANSLGISNQVIFKGVDKDAIKYVESSSCYVLSSIYEGMPNSLMEALAVGTPCISTDCKFGPSELIENGFNGLIVPVKDYKSMSLAMARMVDDKDFAIKVSSNAKRILFSHSIDTISNKYLTFIKKICEG